MRGRLARLAARGVPYVIISHGNFEAGIGDRAVRDKARAVFRGAYKAAFVADSMVSLVERQIAAKLDNAVVVRNPVNLSRVGVIPWPAGDGPVRMAHVARAEVTSKGPDLLMEALSQGPWPGRDWRLTLYGEGPGKEYLQDLARFYAMADRVDFPGHVNDIDSVWATHHLSVLPSRSEGVPLALVEAMLCGRPVVATDVGGVAEWVTDPETGFLIAAPTVRAITETMERVWASRDRWPEIGLRCTTRPWRGRTPTRERACWRCCWAR